LRSPTLQNNPKAARAMVGTEGLLDVAVRRLMRLTQVSGAELPMESPEEWDREKLRQLDITTTSGDTLITIKFPSGEYFDCDGFQVSNRLCQAVT
jgi:hypothetical protein